MSFYYGDWRLRDRWVMQMHCAVYRYHAAKQADRGGAVAFRRHHHEMLELLSVRKGSLSVNLDGRDYSLQAGDTLVVNPFQLHYGEWSQTPQGHEYLCLTVDLSAWLSLRHPALPHCAEGLLAGDYCLREFYPADEGGAALLAQIEKIDRLFGQQDASDACALASRVYGLLGQLMAPDKRVTRHAGKQKRDMEFMRRVAYYLSEHYTEPISTADIAGALFMTVPCFCYTFKRYFGASFLNYLCQYRVTRATELYRQGDMSLAELAAAVGFTDYGYFSRSFKKYMGEAPAVYFGKWEK